MPQEDYLIIMAFEIHGGVHDPDRWLVFKNPFKDPNYRLNQKVEPIASIFREGDWWLIEDNYHPFDFYQGCVSREQAEMILTTELERINNVGQTSVIAGEPTETGEGQDFL